jgi:Flp pilus assembly protein TadD
MTAGFVLALLPTAVILTGFVACAIRFFKHPEAVWFILLGLAVTAYAAVVYMSLKLPFYCSAKAFYALITLLPMCALGAAGWEVLTRFSGRLRPVLYVAAGVWAINACASFWIAHGTPATRTVQGYYYTLEGRPAEGIAELAAALKLDPNNTLARKFLAAEQLRRGNLDAARSDTAQLLAEDPDNPEGLIESALLQANGGHVDAAIQIARHTIEVAPDFGLAYGKLSGWLARSGKNQEAADAAREGLRIQPFSPALHTLLAAALDKLADPVEANQHYQIASDLYPDSASGHHLLGASLARLNRWPAAIAHFREACRLQPGQAEFQFHLALACEKAQLAAEAIQAYRNLLKLDPNSAIALNNLAWLLATSPDEKQRNGAEAAALAGRACDLAGRKNVTFLATLAAACAEAGRFDDAVACATQAIQLAQASGGQETLATLEPQLELYRAHRPYHQEAFATTRDVPSGN